MYAVGAAGERTHPFAAVGVATKAGSGRESKHPIRFCAVRVHQVNWDGSNAECIVVKILTTTRDSGYIKMYMKHEPRGVC